MKLILGERCSGKTDHLIKMSDREDMLIVCANTATVKLIIKRAREQGWSIPKPITYKQFLSKPVKHEPGYLIDNVEYFLRLLNVKGISLSAKLPNLQILDTTGL